MRYKFSKLLKENSRLTYDELIHPMYVDRCTGETTGRAFAVIGWCMQNPEQPYKIKGESNQRMNQFLFDLIHDLVKKYELNYFKFSVKDYSITYRPYGYVEKKWVEVE